MTTAAFRSVIAKPKALSWKATTTTESVTPKVILPFNIGNKKGPARTQEEKIEYSKRGRCYTYGELGHISPTCPTKSGNTSTIKLTSIDEGD